MKKDQEEKEGLEKDKGKMKKESYSRIRKSGILNSDFLQIEIIKDLQSVEKALQE